MRTPKLLTAAATVTALAGASTLTGEASADRVPATASADGAALAAALQAEEREPGVPAVAAEPIQRAAEEVADTVRPARLTAPAARREVYERLYRRAERLDLDPGRNIVEDGVREDGETREPTWREVDREIRSLRRDIQRAERAQRPGEDTSDARAANGAEPAANGEPAGGSAAGGRLAQIAACESGGDPGAVDPSGTYRGKYQFDMQTWASVGGSGDPAAASESEQDRRAAMLMAQRGNNPWPNC